ncbi:hypothetical protein C5E45_22095 [Nocardia nova]|uniref:Uncharacterized protein n=1 Tax=Nocardia nova TaxID=37330 RepID=A0A2S6ALJ4_9NOCA|nr:hypothetical protein C5E41_16730 [Nocardia nova]PPJ36097.1 hypothetical protein C5E45_22095 [Nocardia nova]
MGLPTQASELFSARQGAELPNFTFRRVLTAAAISGAGLRCRCHAGDHDPAGYAKTRVRPGFRE